MHAVGPMDKKEKKPKLTVTKILVTIIVVFLLGWFCFNPPGRFGICRFGATVYSGIPRSPVSDFQVRCDGKTRSLAKTHDLKYKNIEWLLAPMPDVLIISTGWNGVVVPSEKIRELDECEVKMLKTPDAVKLYNKLKKEGRKVAIHVHPTC